MAIALALVLYGAALIIAGWKNLSVKALVRGDASTEKGEVVAAGPLGGKASK